ncbi:hypothetical protein [Microbacterium enclense]|uniref:hypothetical protein n=1 Tax=Microbacterium enclense TaxID=993073 RepID=UPI003F81C72D
MQIETIYAVSDPHSSPGDALAQLKARLDATVAESIVNIQRTSGGDAMWNLDPGGHSLVRVAGDGASGEHFLASAILLVTYP